MSAISIQLEYGGDSNIATLLDSFDFTSQARFFDELADDFEILTREHIARAATTRHKTAARLGAPVTGYLEKLATGTESVRGQGSPGRVRLTLQGEIFKRAFGPVTVTATQAKMLTIPWSAAAYGKRAGEFSDLFVFKSKRGAAFLARRIDKSKIEFLFLLKKSVTLPQDRGLLPDDAAFLAVVEKAAQRYVEAELARLT
ncbi:MAG: hypothetical protein WAW39_00795 [Prosthecobacter sp.]|uniref:hypothetical protein n=1 Tax=Prosthecobacter sp. TaxID=1965333 RepID=UPI003BAE9309